jgi:hypothetical protein
LPVALLGFSNQTLPLAQGLLPARLQLGCYEPVGWVGHLVAPAGDLDLVVGLLDL